MGIPLPASRWAPLSIFAGVAQVFPADCDRLTLSWRRHVTNPMPTLLCLYCHFVLRGRTKPSFTAVTGNRLRRAFLHFVTDTGLTRNNLLLQRSAHDLTTAARYQHTAISCCVQRATSPHPWTCLRTRTLRQPRLTSLHAPLQDAPHRIRASRPSEYRNQQCVFLYAMTHPFQSG